MTTQLTIYPSHCHVLSLTLGKWCPLRIVDVLNLREVEGFEGQQIFFHLNHPIKWIKLTGVIVAIDEFYNRICYTIDDSSGSTIEAICLAPPKPDVQLPSDRPSNGVSSTTSITAATATGAASATDDMVSPDGPKLKGVDVGSVVKVKGCITLFRDTRQIAMKSVVVLGNTNAEVKAWKERTKFRDEIMRVPWVVTPEEEKQCLKEAEGERWREEEKAKREEARKKRRVKGKGREREEETMRRRREERVRVEQEEREKEREKEKQEKSEMGRREREAREKARKKRGISHAARLRAIQLGGFDALGL